MSKNLHIMIGLPGSGKSYWLKENALSEHIISRDEVRFSMLSDGDEYFANEKKVYKEYVRRIQEALDLDEDNLHVYADATHINWDSRKKLLNSLRIDSNLKIHIIYIDATVGKCIFNNKERTDRANVKARVIKQFAERFTHPAKDSILYDSITTVRFPKKR